jgi:hypothetical protein
MKEIELPKEENQIKKDWEVPKLVCLDKGKTEGGTSTGSAETGGTYVFAS